MAPHANVVSGGETPATVLIDFTGDDNTDAADAGIDRLQPTFPMSPDRHVETQLSGDVRAGDATLPVECGLETADGIRIERTGTYGPRQYPLP